MLMERMVEDWKRRRIQKKKNGWRVKWGIENTAMFGFLSVSGAE